jgi:hypothetical protein
MALPPHPAVAQDAAAPISRLSRRVAAVCAASSAARTISRRASSRRVLLPRALVHAIPKRQVIRPKKHQEATHGGGEDYEGERRRAEVGAVADLTSMCAWSVWVRFCAREEGRTLQGRQRLGAETWVVGANYVVGWQDEQWDRNGIIA